MIDRISRTIMAAVIASMVSVATLAEESPAPVRLNQDKLAGIGLNELPVNQYADILVAGEMNIRLASLFDGTEITVSVFESTPAKTDHRMKPFVIDEFVYVLSGKLILTEPNGTVHEYTPGDSLVVPVGYAGTWEMQGNYRELVVLKKKPKKN